jgi:hypothetical protein
MCHCCLQEPIDVGVSKTASVPSVVVGGLVTYTVVL